MLSPHATWTFQHAVLYYSSADSTGCAPSCDAEPGLELTIERATCNIGVPSGTTKDKSNAQTAPTVRRNARQLSHTTTLQVGKSYPAGWTQQQAFRCQLEGL